MVEPYYFAGFTPPYYTPVPDALFDELLAELTGNEVKVLLYIIRRTFGFKKERDTISLSQLTDGIVRRNGTRLDKGAGVSRAGAQVAVKGLLAKGCIMAERQSDPDGGDAPTCYSLRFQTGGLESSRGDTRNQQPPLPAADTPPSQILGPQESALQEHREQEGVARRIVAPSAFDVQAGRHPTGKKGGAL